MSSFSHSDLHLTFRNWSSSSSEMSDNDIRRRRRRLTASSEQDTDNQDGERHLQTDSNDIGDSSDLIRLPWMNHNVATGTIGNANTNVNEFSQRSISDRRRELSMLFNVLRETSENTEWNRRQDFDSRHRRFPIGFINSHFRFTGRAIDYSFDLDHHHDDEESDDYYIDDGIFDTNIRLKNFKNRFAKSNAVYGNTFFKNHPSHEMENHIHMKVEKYGLTSLLDELLVERSHQNKISMKNASTTTRKRSYVDACFIDHNPSFSTNDTDVMFTTLQKSSFLQNGNTFTSKTKLSDSTISLTFTDISYEDHSSSGYLKVGNVKLGFTGKIVDFIDNDLRCDSLTPIMIESNAFSNLLRNKFIHSSKFNKLFEKTAKKTYNKENWKPFSMNRMGYIKFNWIHNKSFGYPHLIQSLKGTKFPNGSVFHKIKASGENQLETFKCLSKWFDIAPFNQFNNTPAPPTPPNNLHKCSNNPENLLACKDCISMVLSKYIFLKLAIDVDDVFENSGTVYSDYIYKHRRRFNYYASKLAKKNNHNLRTHMDTTLDRTDVPVSAINIPPLSSNSTQQPVLNQRNALSDSEESSENHDSRQGTPEDMLDQQSHNAENENEDDYDREEHVMSSDNEIGYLDSIIPSSGGDLNETTDSFAEPWPLSDERSGEYHPILDPVFNEESEDDLDTPYNYTIHNDNRRISRLLFNINMVRQQYTPTREPVSALRMYKGNNKDRLKIVMMVSINRKTGELQMSPGNIDPNSWSSEQNDGELFEDVETFSKVFSLFMNDNEDAYQNITKYTKEAKKWIKRNHPEEAEQIKTLLALQILTNPSIINAYRQREESKQANATKREGKIFRDPNMHTMKRSSKRKKHQLNANNLCFNDEEQEKLQLYIEESKNFEADPQKVITMKPGINVNDVETNGLNLSFKLE